ncbi:hypothetical protein A2U01_0086021 [Trifolium medium]|uniref:Uncharacterized protein n=1 Tax=Trifolium medium TaxID=97028 RepID=A0A392TUC3_9FABA|nr:hypothetical protein [Trifolium medium]
MLNCLGIGFCSSSPTELCRHRNCVAVLLLYFIDRPPFFIHMNSSQRNFLRRVFNFIPNPAVPILP